MGHLTIILRNRTEYRLILSRRGRRPSWLKSGDIPHRLSRIIVLLFNTLITKRRFLAENLEAIFICRKKKLVTFSRARTGMNESGSFVQVWIEYSSGEPTAPVKFSAKLYPQKLKPNSILRLRRICCVSRAERGSVMADITTFGQNSLNLNFEHCVN